jgi:hypothetical protein
MANPTTNFGWVMPTATDLVTDLPADFNVFGQAVDTSMAQLKGGTTAQVLSKTSNTDMAFTWVTPQVGDITGVTAGTGISGGGTSGTVTVTNDMATTITTAGDLIYGTGSGTYTRRGIGTTAQVLTVSGGVPTWATPAGAATNWTLLNSGGTALTGAATITVSFTAPKKIMVMMVGASAGARSFFTLRPNNISTADYSAAGLIAQFSNTPGSYAVTYGYGAYSTWTDIPMGTMANNAATIADATCTIELTDQTGWKDFISTAGGTNTSGEGNQIYAVQGILEAAATITSITLLSSVGNFDAGTVYVLGAN